MASLPSDVILDILAALPMKDVVRFRCVSKSFRTLIDSQEFAKLHLSRSKKTNSNLFGISEHVPFEYPNFMIYDLSNSVDNISQVMLNVPSGFEPTRPWKVVGSCDGLIALLNVRDPGARIWNPFTGEFRNLSFCVSHSYPISCGFGYDPKTDDYKFVRIAAFHNSNDECPNEVPLEVLVYSLKSNSWRKVGKNLYLNCKYTNSWTREAGVLANNALHWRICDENDNWKILAFDLVKEKLCSLPVSRCIRFKSWMNLSALDGCLAVTCSYEERIFYGLQDFVGVWVMKDYAVKRSWTKVLSCFRYELGYAESASPMAYSSSGDKVLLSTRCAWFWYSLISEKFNFKSRRKGALARQEVKIFRGSLLAVNGSTDLVNSKRKQAILQRCNEENKEKKRMKLGE